tara:strand:+ start:495 stop:1136 length:642 start_codon:yes stop_codon:yes gene_type:complete
MNNFKINKNKIKKGGANTEYNSSLLVNTSNPVDTHFSTGSLEQPSKTEFKNTHGCPIVSHRNGGENDVKPMVGASKLLTSPNEDSQIQSLINNCHHWTKYKNTYQAEDDVNTGPGIYIWTEANKFHGIYLESKIAYVGLTKRSLGERSKEHYFKCVKPNFHTWLGQVEKNGKLLILFKSFPKKHLEKIEYYFIQKLNPIFNIIHNNGGKKYVR